MLCSVDIIMVLLSYVHRAVSFSKAKSKYVLQQKSSFIDKLRIYVRGGPGGQGFKRYGGIGGKGGDVYVEASEGVTLAKVRAANPKQRFTGTQGGDSRRHGLLGGPGADLIIPVPVGVSVLLDNKQAIGDLNAVGEKVMVARGGLGGRPENQYVGERGAARSISLDLKLIADIGLVGFPNAGKSTLLAAISRAKPKIANYPFTTIKPQIGVLDYGDHRQITMADLPGLIEGAHVNVGMGHHFLKHVERTKLLLFVVDVFGFKLGMKYPERSALETILLLHKELELYKDSLVLGKPAMLVLNKLDKPGATAHLDEVLKGLDILKSGNNPGVNADFMPSDVVRFDDVIAVSAKTGTSVELVKERVRQLLDSYADERLRSDSARALAVKNADLDVRERDVSVLV